MVGVWVLVNHCWWGVVVDESGFWMAGLLINGAVSRMEIEGGEHHFTGKYLSPDNCSCDKVGCKD